MSRKTKQKPCEHESMRYDWRTIDGVDRATSRHCTACGALVPFGVANDEPAEVQVEIHAAEFTALEESLGPEAGWLARQIAAHGEYAQAAADILRDLESGAFVEVEYVVGDDPEPSVEDEDVPDSPEETALLAAIASAPPLCPGCKQEVDPETCQCGEAADDHNQGAGHGPVPMGCVCHRSAEDREPGDLPMPANSPHRRIKENDSGIQ